MDTLKRINRFFYKICKESGALVLFLLVAIITISIIARYFFNSPFTWTEELCTVLFIWFSFLGATIATYEKRHVSVDIITSRLPKKVNNVIRLFTNILIMIFFILLAVGACILFPTMTHSSVALKIPKWFYYVPIMISSVMMFFMYLADTIDFVSAWFKNGKEGEKA